MKNLKKTKISTVEDFNRLLQRDVTHSAVMPQ